VLVIHGGTSSADAWTPVARALADVCAINLYDRATYRTHLASRGKRSLNTEVADVLTVLDRIGEATVLVGHDSGAIIALLVAIAAPGRVRGLVLYEPPIATSEPYGGTALVEARAAVDVGKYGHAMRIHLGEIVGLSKVALVGLQIFKTMWASIAAQAPSQIADDEAVEYLGVGTERYSGIDTPTLLIGGSKSPAHFRDRLEALCAAMPNASIEIVEGRDHTANLADPAGFAQLIASFVERPTP
jgi:pimeloyl-ACP methyl ester carboxylesterase